ASSPPRTGAARDTHRGGRSSPPRRWQSTLRERGASCGTGLGWPDGGRGLRQSTVPWAEPCFACAYCLSSFLPPLSRTGRRDFVGCNGVNGQRILGHALENDREVLAAGRPAKRFRLAAAPAPGRGLVICRQHLFDLFPGNAVAFDTDVPVVSLWVVFQIPDESHSAHDHLSPLFVIKYKRSGQRSSAGSGAGADS